MFQFSLAFNHRFFFPQREKVIPTAIKNVTTTGKMLRDKDLKFCKKHTRFDDKEKQTLSNSAPMTKILLTDIYIYWVSQK